MWEVYLPPFEAAVRAGAGSLMASFNEIDGTPGACEPLAAHRRAARPLEVRRPRRERLDRRAGAAQPRHRAKDPATAARRALGAGVDMEMSSALYRNTLAAEVKAGRFPIARVNEAVRRVLLTKAALGLFDDPYRKVRAWRASERHPHAGEPRGGARDRRASRSSCSPTGPSAARRRCRCARTCAPSPSSARSPTTRVRRSARGAGRDAPRKPSACSPAFARALPQRAHRARARRAGRHREHRGFAEAERAARDADAVLLVLGERGDMTGEATSRASIELPGSQLALAQAVVRAAGQGKPVVAVLMNGRPLAVQWLADSASALVESWYLGVEHGNALADVLFGDVAPSGKLPVTFPRVTGQVPIYYAHKNTGRPADREQALHVEVPRPAVDAALPVRARAVVHDVRVRRSASVARVDPRRRSGGRRGDRAQHRLARGHRGRAALSAPRRGERDAARARAARVPARGAQARRDRGPCGSRSRRRHRASTISTCGASWSRARSRCSPAAARRRRSHAHDHRRAARRACSRLRRRGCVRRPRRCALTAQNQRVDAAATIRHDRPRELPSGPRNPLPPRDK